jgi:hypothetical protein
VKTRQLLATLSEADRRRIEAELAAAPASARPKVVATIRRAALSLGLEYVAGDNRGQLVSRHARQTHDL